MIIIIFSRIKKFRLDKFLKVNKNLSMKGFFSFKIVFVDENKKMSSKVGKKTVSDIKVVQKVNFFHYILLL